MTDINDNKICIGDKVYFCTSIGKMDKGTVQSIYVNPNNVEACIILAADGRTIKSIYSDCIYDITGEIKEYVRN